MSDSKLKILSKIQEGEISVDEGLEMLNNVQRQERPITESPTQESNPIFSFVTEAKNLFEKISKENYLTYNATSEVDANSIKSITAVGKNARVEIMSHEKNCISVNTYFSVKHDRDPMVEWQNVDGRYSLNYDTNAVRLMEIQIRVPDILIENLVAISKNAKITFENLKFERATATTSCADISVTNCSGHELRTTTTNASTKLRRVNVSRLESSTSNAKINVSDCFAETLNLSTSNASISTGNTIFYNVTAKTSNAPISFENFGPIMNKQSEQIYVYAATSNSNISFTNVVAGLPIKVNASTSNGPIRVQNNNLSYSSNSPSYINAQSQGFESSSIKFDLELKTSNGSINIS